MNLINKLSLFVLLVNVPAYQFYLRHHNHCGLSSSWSVNLSDYRVLPSNKSSDSSNDSPKDSSKDSSSGSPTDANSPTIVEPMRLTRQDGNVTLVALLDAS